MCTTTLTPFVKTPGGLLLGCQRKRVNSNSNSTETSNGLFKTEVIRKRGPWRSIDDVEFATLEWVDWFNNRRLLEPIGDIPPAEFEELHWIENGRTDTIGLKGMSLHRTRRDSVSAPCPRYGP